MDSRENILVLNFLSTSQCGLHAVLAAMCVIFLLALLPVCQFLEGHRMGLFYTFLRVSVQSITFLNSFRYQ